MTRTDARTYMQISWLSFLAAAAILAAAGCSPVGGLDIQSSIREVVEAEDSENVQRFYEHRSHEPAWVEGREATEQLRAAIRALCAAEAHGLDPDDYLAPEIAQTIRLAYGGDPESNSARALRLAELDVAVSKALMEMADDLLAGRVSPQSLDSTWRTPVNDVDPVAVLTEAVIDADLSSISRRITEAHDQYAALLEALERYRDVQRKGGLPAVDTGPALSPGDSSARVASVARRLVAGGDLDSTDLEGTTLVYTDRVAAGVRSFQERHGLDADGVLGENVVHAMNVPIEDRISQIQLNLERWRWIPANLGGRFLYVNIPAFELHAFQDGAEVLHSKVVVGNQYDARSTPIFSDTMEYVVFNPYWNIPESIAAEEILPDARADSSYLSANEYEIVSGWDEGAGVVPVTPRNLDRVESGRYRIRQRPGPQNALGRIKFMFPNEFNIYLHDTPEDHLFERTDRAYSHGCIRVEREIELAEYALTGWSAGRVEETIARGDRHVEYLQDPMPVYILYWTSFVDHEGRVHFRKDIYGHDDRLRSALAETSPETASVSCDSLLSAL